MSIVPPTSPPIGGGYRGFVFFPEILNTDSRHEPDESDALTLSWEGATRARGSIAQRIDKDGNICISIYVPNIIETE